MRGARPIQDSYTLASLLMRDGHTNVPFVGRRASCRWKGVPCHATFAMLSNFGCLTNGANGIREPEKVSNECLRMPRESLKLATRADAAKAALAASLAARDAGAAREVSERSLEEIHVLTVAVEALNEGLSMLGERITKLQSNDITADLAALTKQVEDLARGAKKSAKRKKTAD
jgi:hypothetical protein